jgi:hypothetical protein
MGNLCSMRLMATVSTDASIEERAAPSPTTIAEPAALPAAALMLDPTPLTVAAPLAVPTALTRTGAKSSGFPVVPGPSPIGTVASGRGEPPL